MVENRPISEFSDAYDSRVSGRISMQSFNNFNSSSSSSSSSLPADLLFSLLLSKVLLSLSLFIGRNWILNQNFSIIYFFSLILFLGGLGLSLWEKIWFKSSTSNKNVHKRKEDSNSLYPILYALEILFSILALSKLSVLRHVMLTSFSTLWSRGLPLSFSSSSSSSVSSSSSSSSAAAVGKKSIYNYNNNNNSSGKSSAVFITFGMILFSYGLDLIMSSGSTSSATSSGNGSILGYTYLLLHLIICGERIELLNSHPGDSNSRARIHAIGVMTSACLGGLAALVRWTFDVESFYYAPPPIKLITEFGLPSPTSNLLYSSAALLALSMILVDPLLSRALLIHFPVKRQVGSGWPIAVGSTLLVGYIGFGESLSLVEGVIGGLAWTAISQLVSSDPRFTPSISPYSSSSSSNVIAPEIKRPLLVTLSIFSSHLRSTIKTILATPESRRIYFFLCLNLAYMVIQMVYGVLTNSLGLISDSIHMFFDCLALGMGLFASVMATWEPNQKFTYGYSRVETLSGFANGLFLCLISIFIVFEAIQRLIDPPEMNTSQLLVVSSVGLAVNLVGMLATGGHHHHGHSHGGHDHGPKKVAALPAQDFTYSAHNNHEHDSHAGHNHSANSNHNHDHDHSSHNHDDDDDEVDDHSGHSHGHSHNMKGVFLHVLADTLGSVGVIISTLLINRYGWTGFDPLASIFIAVLIFASVVPLVTDAGRLLVLDMGEDREEEVKKALTLLNGVEGVASYSMARFWPRDPSTMIGSISIQLATTSSIHSHQSHESISTTPLTSSSPIGQNLANIEQVTARVKKVLRSGIGGLTELTVQVTV